MKAALVAVLVATLAVGSAIVAAPALAFTATPAPEITVGEAPVGVTFNPAGDKAYAAINHGAKIAVVDLSDNSVSSFAAGASPMGIAFIPSGLKAYIPNYDDAMVTVVDPSGTVLTTIPVEVAPFFVAASPDGNWVFVPNAGSASVSAIWTATDTVIANVPVGVAPVAVAFSPDSSTAYVANSNDDVTVIKVSDLTTTTIPLSGTPYGIAVSPDGASVYVSQNSDATVSVISTTTKTVTATIPVGNGPTGVTFRPGGRLAFVPTADDAISVIDVATQTTLAPIPVGTVPRHIAFTADGSLAVTGNTGEFATPGFTVSLIAVDFTVTFDAAGGSAVTPQDIVKGAKATAPTAPTRAGYAFDGWYHGATRWNFSTATVTSDVTLVASWLVQPTITGASTATAPLDALFSYTPTVTAQPGFIATSTPLPTGLTLASATGVISGIPTGPLGATLVTLTVSDVNGTATFPVTITVTHGAAMSLTITPSDTTPTQGDTITLAIAATDAHGNTWDASSTAVVTSDVASDVVVGNTVKFVHASPHVLTASVGVASATRLVQVASLASRLASTGGALPIGLTLWSIGLLISGAGALFFVARRRRRTA